MKETWKVYKDKRRKGTTGCLWEISNYGNVRKNGELLTFVPGNYYIQVAGDYLHRIVTNLFIVEIPKGYEVEHIDCNKHNNSVDNLRIVTHKENQNNPITKEQISVGNKKYFETHESPCKGKKRGTSWNKGLTKETDERIAQYAVSRLGIEPWNKGKKCPNLNWNKGQTKETNESLKRAGDKISKMFKGRKKNVWFDDEGKKHWKWAE